MSLSPDLVRILRGEAERVVPFVGAGLAADAGLPAAGDFARRLAARAQLDERLNFDAVCRAIEERLGLGQLQRRAAETVQEYLPQPTQTLMLLARCPSQILLTANYDLSIEASVEQAGKRPRTLSLSDAGAWARPTTEDVVHVLHVHGTADDASSMILTTRQRQALAADEAFRQGIRALVRSRRIVCLGFQLAIGEEHLRAQLSWLSATFRDQEPAILLLPEDEADRRSDLDVLVPDRVVDVHTFHSDGGFTEVRQVAQILAPQPAAASDHISREVAPETEYFVDPPLLRVEGAATEEELRATAMMADAGIGSERYSAIGELVEANRALIVGAPGMGKSELLRQLGRRERSRAIYLPAASIDGEGEAPAALLRALNRSGAALGPSCAVPTADRMLESSFVLLIDAIDEVAERERGRVIAQVAGAAQAWPQHSWVATSRDVAELRALREDDFLEFRLVRSEAWGPSYLDRRGVSMEIRQAAMERAPTLAPLLQIPRYAEHIAEEFLEHSATESLPTSALQLLLSGERRVLEGEAGREGVSGGDLYAWMQAVATGLELSGRNEGAVAELADLPGPGTLSSLEARTLLVERAFLRDVEDTVAFNATVSQEALCADAVLSRDDPLETLRIAAVAEVDGRETLRSDLEHVLDLVFEAASANERAELRTLDELRWARTQPTSAAAETIADAIDTIRAWHRDRRVWLRFGSENNLRGPGEAIKYLAAAHPEVLDGRRDVLVAETHDPDPTIRTNAVELLTLLPPDDETEPLLRRLLEDDNTVVRRHVAHAIEHFALVDLSAPLVDAYSKTSDELELGAIGGVLLEFAADSDLEEAIRQLATKRIGWRRNSYRALPRLSLEQVANLALSNDLDSDDVRDALRSWFERYEQQGATGDDMFHLARLLVAFDGLPHGWHSDPRVLDLVSRHPNRAIEGAEGAAAEDASIVDVYWMRAVPDELLAEVTAGPLAQAVSALRDVLVRQRAASAAAEAEVEADPEARGKPRSRLVEMLDQGEIHAGVVPSIASLWELPELAYDVQQQVLAFAEEWTAIDWPETPPRDDGHLTVINGISAAVVVWVALDTPPEGDRWLRVLSSGILSLDDRYSAWAARHFRNEWSSEAAMRIERFSDSRDIVAAARAIPNWDGHVQEAFVASVLTAHDESAIRVVLEGLRDARAQPAIRLLADSEWAELASAAKLELAATGDVDAQKECAQRLLDDLSSAGLGFDHHLPRWLEHVESEELIPELRELLRAAHSDDDLPLFRRSLEAALARMGSERALAVYDDLMADESLQSRQFYCYQRDALARELARQKVSARLPGTLAGVAD